MKAAWVKNGAKHVRKQGSREVGTEYVTAYSGTRHSFASHAINDGYSLEIIGEILGHSDIRTTKKYAYVSMEAMRKLMERK